MLEDSLNRNIISNQRNEDGSYKIDEDTGTLNQQTKERLLNDIKERERRIFGHYEQKTQKSRNVKPTLKEISDSAYPNDEISFLKNTQTSIGYNEKRNGFEIEFDEDAEANITEIDFSMLFTEDEIKAKHEYLKVYNERLDERERRKNFIISRGLTNLQTIVDQESKLDSNQREILHQLNPIACYMSNDQFDKLKQDSFEEYRLSMLIEQLKILDKEGYKTIGDVENFLKSESIKK